MPYAGAPSRTPTATWSATAPTASGKNDTAGLSADFERLTDGGYDPFSAAKIAIPIVAPTFKLSVVSDNQITLDWDDVLGAGDYRVLDAADDREIAKVSDSSYTYKELTNGKTYRYKVYAKDADGLGGSDHSIMVSATPDNAAARPAPGNFVAKGYNGKIKLSWEAVDGGGAYGLYQVVSGESTLLTSFSGLTYEHKELTNGELYRYNLIALNSKGESGIAETTAVPLATPVISEASFIEHGVANIVW